MKRPAGRLDEQTGHGPATTVAPLAAVDPLMVVIARERLRDFVLRRSLGARGAFAAFADALGLSPADRIAHPVHLAIQRLDYDRALTLIDAPLTEGLVI